MAALDAMARFRGAGRSVAVARIASSGARAQSVAGEWLEPCLLMCLPDLPEKEKLR
jgi:hypothetical protein